MRKIITHLHLIINIISIIYDNNENNQNTGSRAAVHSNWHSIMVHMKEAGPVRVKLPSKAKRIVDITDGSTIAHDTDSLLYTSSSDSSAIFLG